jgi:hypothetical protein
LILDDVIWLSQQILKIRPDLLSPVFTVNFKRFPTLTPEESMVIAGIPTDQLLHTRFAQILLDRGRGLGEATVTLRLLNRRCGRARFQRPGPLAQPCADAAGCSGFCGW